MAELYSYTGTGFTVSQNALQPQAWVVTLTADGPLNLIRFASALAGRDFKAAVYSHNGGSTGGTERPLTLLATSGVHTSTASGYVSVTVPSPPSGVVGQKFFVVTVTETSGNWQVAGPNATFRVRGNNLAAFSDPFPSTWTTSVAGSASNGMPNLIIESTQASITSVDTIKSGQSFNLTLSDAGYAATQLVITDSDGVTKAVAITGSGGNFSGTGPALSDLEEMLRIGTVNVYATNGVQPTATRTATYAISSPQPDNATPRDFSSVTLTSVAVNNIGSYYGFNPPLKVGTQSAFETARATVNADGTMDFEDYTGTSIYYFRDPDDFICRTWTVETVNGTPVPSAPKYRVTATRLTASPLTASRLTAAPI